MPNPLEAVVAFLNADAPNLPAGFTKGVNHPSDSTIAKVHVQYAWDGTPSDADNREDAAVRVTVWAPKGQVTLASVTAGGLRKRLLDYSSALVHRVDRGTGRLPGIDPDTDLPFCTFTVNAVMRAL